jgi:hypothetical protein
MLHEYRLARAAVEQSTQAAAAATSVQQQGSFQAGQLQAPQQQQQQQQSSKQGGKQAAQQPAGHLNGASSHAAAAATSQSEGGSSSSGSAGMHSTDASTAEPQEAPPAWLDVTDALQYLVAGGKLELHGGVSKLGLMGFADVAPKAEKELYVAYCYQRQLFEKVVGDTELLRLPGAGEPVCETSIAERLWAKYRRGYQEHVQQQK